MSADTFICAMCGQTFEKDRDDSEALAETKFYFGDVPESELTVVCDDCFQSIHPGDHPNEVQDVLIKLKPPNPTPVYDFDDDDFLSEPIA